MTHKLYNDKMQGKMVSVFEDIKGASIVIYHYMKKDGYMYIDELEGKNLDFLHQYPMVQPEMISRFVSRLTDLGVMLTIHNDGWVVVYKNYVEEKEKTSIRYDKLSDAWKELNTNLANEIIGVNMRTTSEDKVNFLVDKKANTASIVINGLTICEYKVEPCIKAS